MNNILFYTAGTFVSIWGIAHLFPTKNVVKGFGDITQDNKRIIAMEWIIEGLALIFLGLLVITVTIIDSGGNAANSVYWLSFGMLVSLSLVSLLTGFKINFLPFKLCPAIFTVSASLILLGILLR